MSSIIETMEAFKKDFGDKTAIFGSEQVDSERLPTGIFEFDLSTGGGLPRGSIIIIYGPESSGKTNMAYGAISQHQRLYPDQSCVFFDMEFAFSAEWATKLGVDCEKLIIVTPSYAEQAADMVEEVLEAADCGLVVLDSIAAMATTKEISAQAEKMVPGGSSMVINRMIKKCCLIMGAAEKEKRAPTLLLINQIRFKIAVQGDPETLPGGQAQKFASFMTIRLYGRNVMDDAVSNMVPCRKHGQAVLKKWKVPIVAVHSEFDLVTYPHRGKAVGEYDDWKVLRTMLERYEFFGKKGKGWFLGDEEFPTMKAAVAHLYGNKELLAEVKHRIIELALEEAHGGEE